MMNEMRNLFTYNKTIYTMEALNKELGINVEAMKTTERHKIGVSRFFRVCTYKNPNKASFVYLTTEGEKIGWQFGEKVFYDTEEERDQAREEYRLEYEAIKYRNRLLKQIQELSTEELEKIVANLK